MKIALGVLAFCALAACSSASVVASSSAPLDQVALGESVIARGCTFTIGTGVEEPPSPPLHVAFVRVTGNQHVCPHGDVVLGTSYALPSVAITVAHGDVVADWSSSSPSGEPPTLFIAEIAPESGEIVKETELEDVRDGALDIRGDALVVTGDKDGVIPGERGSGDHYTATYARFFDTSETAPTTVIAY